MWLVPLKEFINKMIHNNYVRMKIAGMAINPYLCRTTPPTVFDQNI